MFYAFQTINSFIFMQDIFFAPKNVSGVITPSEFARMADNGEVANITFRGDVETIVTKQDGKLYEVKPILNSEVIHQLRSKSISITYEPARITTSKISFAARYLLAPVAILLIVLIFFVFYSRRRSFRRE
jgi:ATP-dependent Zn protease